MQICTGGINETDTSKRKLILIIKRILKLKCKHKIWFAKINKYIYIYISSALPFSVVEEPWNRSDGGHSIILISFPIVFFSLLMFQCTWSVILLIYQLSSTSAQQTSVCNYTGRYSNTTFMVKPQYIYIYIYIYIVLVEIFISS